MMHLRKISAFLFIGCCVAFLSDCGSVDLYQREVAIPNQKWESDFTPKFEFAIGDTTSYYTIYLYFRHTNFYPYSNIWVRTVLIGQDTAEMEKECFFASASRWMGSRITGNIIEHFIPLQAKPMKLKPSNTIVLEQIMRDDPLKEMLAVGVRIQKIKTTK